MTIPAANATYILQQFHLRLGDPYVFGGDYSQTNLAQGADCSYVAGWVLEGLVNGPANMSWAHNVSTESWPYDYTTNTPAAPGTVGPYGTVAVELADVPTDAALLINIMHGGGGADSHMNVVLQGQILESNGDDGTCTNGTGGTLSTDPEWTDHWVLLGPIEGSPVTQPNPQGLDYAGGVIPGAALKAAGYGFVCRYLSPGGSSLPGKQLLAPEVADLHANDIAIVANWESTGTTAQGGQPAGVTDAQNAVAGLVEAFGSDPGCVVFFSIDWDTTPADQTPINAYFQGVASVIGLARTGVYGGYWPVSRALDAGVVTWAWQTQAWSGTNQDSRINILQTSNAGYATVDGIQCDQDVALTTNFGQWPTTPIPGGNVTQPPNFPQPPATTDEAVMQIWGALFNAIPSESRYAAYSSPGGLFMTKDLINFTDARVHEMNVERLALMGDPTCTGYVKAAAAAGDSIAQEVLAKIPATGGTA